MEIYQENGLYGLKNDCGDVLITPQYREFYPFTCGLACVRDNNFQYGYINIFNDTIVPFGKYIWVDPIFKGGYARVKTADNKYWGVIDTAGKIVVIPNMDYIKPLEVTQSPIKNWGECVSIFGTYSGKSVGYVVDKMSRINLPLNFRLLRRSIRSKNQHIKYNVKHEERGHIINSISIDCDSNSDYKDYNDYVEESRLDAFEGDERNVWNID